MLHDCWQLGHCKVRPSIFGVRTPCSQTCLNLSDLIAQRTAAALGAETGIERPGRVRHSAGTGTALLAQFSEPRSVLLRRRGVCRDLAGTVGLFREAGVRHRKSTVTLVAALGPCPCTRMFRPGQHTVAELCGSRSQVIGSSHHVPGW